jgi:hydrogenase maturation protease
MKRPTLILGMGNDLLRDDGVGLKAARRVARQCTDTADLAETCVATIDLLPVLSGYRRVVVLDAFLSDDLPPGSTIQTTPDDLPAGFGFRSFHTLSFNEMLRLGEELDIPMPDHISIHGLVVKEPYTFGERFTEEVEQAWRGWADQVAGMVEQHRGAACSGVV